MYMHMHTTTGVNMFRNNTNLTVQKNHVQSDIGSSPGSNGHLLDVYIANLVMIYSSNYNIILIMVSAGS